MLDGKILSEYERWMEKSGSSPWADPDVADELKGMQEDEGKIKEAFCRDLAFGTGGLRGVIGAGPGRMNVHTVARASQGLANYVKGAFGEQERKIAVSYDSRIKSGMFAEVAARVFAANGFRVFLYPVLMPTPCLSYAVRALGCAAGVMVTASHNPSKYNGYKVYGPDGCQITTGTAGQIMGEIERIDIFDGVRGMDFEEGMRQGLISHIPDEVLAGFVEEVKKQSVLYGEMADKDAPIIYSPFNGTGLVPVLRVLAESGFTNVTVVPEQEKPDGSFPTCPYPNPETEEAMALGMEYAAKAHAELFLATDPDCDRVGIAVWDPDSGRMRLLSGNETGVLLLDYLCAQRPKHGTMPEAPVMVKTIVTTDMAERIASKYGVRTVNVLTGFKFIGEQIGVLEAKGRGDSFLFGFEESCGYLSGTYVRDKDAVGAALLICEMFAYYRAQGASLLDKLGELYAEHGYCLNTLHTYEFGGLSGADRMRDIMAGLRRGIEAIGPRKVVEALDYSQGIDGLPKSDVLKFLLEGNCSVVVRPSGTEPKLKVYINVASETEGEAEKLEKVLADSLSAGSFS